MSYPQSGNGWQQMPPNMPPQPPPYPSQQYPGYYAPPPTKKTKIWLWVPLAILAVVGLAVGGVFGFKYYELNRTVTYTYEVTGTGDTALVSYGHDGRGVTEATEVPLPWSKTFEGTRRSDFQLTANAPYGETVTCTVSIDGSVVVTKTEPSGPWAACTGQYYD
ncbi:hypothetical protein [Mycolicibacterium neworleansense]|uniref:Transmembrane protein, MmpS5_2 n=1 Tax=Mycolicibacterium neworleansense TaxID=146018 RepID=A0A0H5RIZ1_9MYCO|nr:hypothetical protein [Mycolicibacterium neworleansense]MCV7362121.1 hypothetical protein [Mycolicibacterium neworleansense]CRZ13472.1 transmembrane protein, MmpS5_2 [Mycolicibacterium neworleansense]